LTNSHLFKNNNTVLTRQGCHCDVILVEMFLQTVISYSEVHWSVHATAARRSGRFYKDAWGSACIARVSQQCLYENCPQMIEREQWPPNNYPNLNRMEIYLGSDARSYTYKPSAEAQIVSE